MPQKMPVKEGHADVHFDCTYDQYEYLVRQSAELLVGQQSMQNVITNQLFDYGWEKELEKLRKLHRKFKLKDELFLHRQVLKEKGIQAPRKRNQIGIA